MSAIFRPVNPSTPQNEVVLMLEDLILEGKLVPGEKLPPERDMAASMNVSRPVVHDALVELASKGLVTMKPRHGSWINDYRKSGSLELLNALYRYDGGALKPSLDKGLEEMRDIVLRKAVEMFISLEDESAFSFGMDELKEELSIWRELEGAPACQLALSDFNFFFKLVYSCGNPVFPLMFNSAREVYLGLLSRFFSIREYYYMSGVLKKEFIECLGKKDLEAALEVTGRLCAYSTYGVVPGGQDNNGR